MTGDRLLRGGEDVDGEVPVPLDHRAASVRAMTQTSTSSRSSDTEEKEFAVIPYPCSPSRDAADGHAGRKGAGRLHCAAEGGATRHLLVERRRHRSDPALLHPLLDHAVEIGSRAE